MRLFVAIEISLEIRERIAEFVSRSKANIAGARWVRPEGMHITLKFLGNVPDEKINLIENVLRDVQARSFSLSVRNIGFFPNPKSPRVLSAGVDAGPELAQLAEQVDKALAPLGFEPEKRAFNPHITLARFTDRGKKAGIGFVEQQLSFGTMTAKEFHLYQSKLSPQGSRYDKLATFVLN
jgi:RNA 2',3'-cyclic 3'-phosphodiesterase